MIEGTSKLSMNGLRITWLGHSMFPVEIDGRRVLVDLVLSKRPSPFTWAGPTRFHEMPLSIDELPAIDAVVISHDHRTVQTLGGSVPIYIEPVSPPQLMRWWLSIPWKTAKQEPIVSSGIEQSPRMALEPSEGVR